MRQYIEHFMWGFQAHFRYSVASTVSAALREIGWEVEPVVYLVGFLKGGGSGYPVCVEPEDGPLSPDDFKETARRAAELLAADPETKIRHSDPRTHDLRQQGLRDSAWRNAIAEILGAKLGLAFFVAMPTLVGTYHVFTAIGLPKAELDLLPALQTVKAADDDRIVLTRSLVEGAFKELRRQLSRALYEPDPGSGFGYVVEPGDVARIAGDGLAMEVAYRADTSQPAHGFFDAMNQLATTRYEKRAGLGRLVIASPNSPAIDRVLLLERAVPVKETRTLRKLLEVSSGDGAALLTNGSVAYGLGRIKDSYDATSESVFEVVVSGPGSWDLRHAGIPLMSVTYGAPHLPAQPLSRAKFVDTARRIFAPFGGCAEGQLWDLAMAAAEAEHGTMLVVSAEAATEASRLQGQALVVEPTELDVGLIRQLTKIDGAVLVDSDGAVAAIGVILDGVATSEGDRARGARFNSAVRYLAAAPTGTMIVLVSEDGMLDLLPRLRPRVSKRALAQMLEDLRAAAAIEPVNGERFYKAFNRVKANAFYLSDDQCAEANALAQDHWNRRRAAGATVWMDEPALVPHPQMSDEYLTD
jgi:hypothetical protein